MSGARLDRSQEGIELRQAVWAGFIKSRFWRIARWIEPRIKPDAVIGTIIRLGTLLFLGLSFFSVFRQQRPPNPNFFLYTLGPLSVGYVVYENWGLLGRLLESPWWKLFYGLAAPGTVAFCKVLADREIRLLTKSNPSLFPSAQLVVTVSYILVILLAEVSTLMLIPVLWKQLKSGVQTSLQTLLLPFDAFFRVREMLGLPFQSLRSFSSASSLMRVVPYMWGGFFILLVLPIGFEKLGLERSDPTEELLLWSSFIPNDLGLAGSDRVCINLPSNALVSPFNTREPIPNEVLVAQPIATGPDRSGRSYSYRVVACSKLPAPGAL
jgi:hypothetical protein